jgi:hypothetical protein
MPHGIPAQKFYLFHDLRWILCSDLVWRAPDGNVPPLNEPSGEHQRVVAERGMVPYGFRLVAQRPTEHRPLRRGGGKVDATKGVPQTFNAPASDVSPWRWRTVYDSGVYRAWSCRVLDHAAIGAKIEIACQESDNGFDWRVVATSIVPSPGGPHTDGFTVFVDPAAPAAERYKAVFCAPPPADQNASMYHQYMRVQRHNRIPRFSEKWVMAMYGLVSPDGLKWSLLPDHLMVHYSDTDTSVYYDTWLKQYVMYTRLKYQERRWVGRSVSDDFREWSSIDPIIAPSLDDEPSTDVYQNGYTTYPGEPAYQLMFPMFYHRFTQRSDIRQYSSEDGLYWHRVPGESLITPESCGREGVEFMGTGKDLVPMGADKIDLPYFTTTYPHKYPRWQGVLDAVEHAWAVWPKGRLVALSAPGVAEFHTFPIEPMGRSLRLNARIPRGGEVRVGLVGIDGRRVAECDPIYGDSLAHPVTWRGDDNARVQQGFPVTLHFQIRAAELFGYEWV